jgi:hypothetical protein
MAPRGRKTERRGRDRDRSQSQRRGNRRNGSRARDRSASRQKQGSSTHPCWACQGCGFELNYKFRGKCFKCSLLKGHKKPPTDPAKHTGNQPIRGGPTDESTLEGQLKLQLAALADYKAVMAKYPNSHASAAITGMEVAIGELRAKIEAQKSPEARLQAAMSRQAAAQKELKATEQEVQTLAQKLQDAMDLKEAQTTKVATLSAEVAELKLQTLPPPPSVAAPAAPDFGALLQQLAHRGFAVPPEIWSSSVQALQPAAKPEPPIAAAETAAPAHKAPETAPTPEPAPPDEGEGAVAMETDEAARGRKREADDPERAAARKTQCPVADVSVRDMLLRAKGIPVA